MEETVDEMFPLGEGRNKCSKELLVKIDNALKVYFETLESLYQERANLNLQMKSGFLMMSKARYSMGAKSVSPLQYDENNMEATARVNIAEESSEEEKVSSDVMKVFELVREDGDGKSTNIKMSTDSKSSDNGDGLRKRNVEKKIPEEDKTLSIEEISGNFQKISVVESTEKQKVVDPVKWFGVLVPQALRTSQKNFKSATETACNVASLQVRLENARKEYIKLMKEKSSVMSSVAEAAEEM